MISPPTKSARRTLRMPTIIDVVESASKATVLRRPAPGQQGMTGRQHCGEPIFVCLAGAAGWAGSELARAIAGAGDLALSAAISRAQAGRNLGDVLGEARIDCPIYASATEALEHRCNVFVEYTKPHIARANLVAALQHGAPAVVGTSGLPPTAYAGVDGIPPR